MVYGEFNVYDTYEVTLKVFEDDVELVMVSVEPFTSTPQVQSVKSKGNNRVLTISQSATSVISDIHNMTFSRIFTARNEVGEGNIFTGVCDSVTRGVPPPGGGCLVPGSLLPVGYLVKTPWDGYCCRRYASY